MTTLPGRLVAAVAFAAAHTQPLTYYSNQNQYYLHGLALAGRGDLRSDWLANTADPTPVFSALVAVADGWPLHVIFFALVVGYFLALWHLVEALPFAPQSAAGKWAWAATITATHTGIARLVSDRLLGGDYAWFLQAGLANQYLLGPGLQPSVFGVGLVWAVALAARGRMVAAATVAASVNYLHATYLLPAGLLVAGLVFTGWATRSASGLRPSLAERVTHPAGVALLIVAPVIAFHVLRFGPTNPETFREAQHILADVRIPHHARPWRWFDGMAGFQIAWMVVGLAVLWRTRLFVPLAVAFALATVGTLAVIVTDNPTLALAFPWRISAVLVPVTTAVVAARVIHRIEQAELGKQLLVGFAWVMIVNSLIGAGLIYGLPRGYHEPADEDAVLDQIRRNRKPGDVYLIPAGFPRPSSARGVYSATFAPPPDGSKPVFFALSRFRLTTGAAVYVDFKSIPYQDTEVLEWHRRISRCEEWYGSDQQWKAATVDAVRAEGVTHIVLPGHLSVVPSPGVVQWPQVYPGRFVVYEILR